MTRVCADAAMVAALKTATRALIARVGGLDAAASVCRLEGPRLSVCQSLHHPRDLLPIDVVLQLEQVAEEPVVTRVLAQALGHVVARPEPQPAADVARAVAGVVRGAGAAGATLMEATADHHIDAAERADLGARLREVRDAADGALAALAGAEVVQLRGVG